MKYNWEIAESNQRQSDLLSDEDESWRMCSQCGGNDGYLYSTKVRGEWLCKSCHDDHELETYRRRST